MLRLLVLFVLLSFSLAGQGVHFIEVDLDNAIKLAKKQNKSIFIDTYASYCKPCKILAKEFKKPEVASFFNKHFLNVRVNMETTSKSDPYQSKYQIVFLPTMVWASEDGDQLLKLDHLVDSHELLAFGKHIVSTTHPEQIVTNTKPQEPTPQLKETKSPQVTEPVVVADPAPKKVAPKEPEPKKTSPQHTGVTTGTSVVKATPPAETKSSTPTKTKIDPSTVDADDGGKILYVMGQDSEGLPPEILKEEAYFRMTLMDGSHHEAAQNYLATQEDWGSPDNLRFIHDFLHDSRSDEFKYLIDNRAAFEKELGQEHIDQTIHILVYKELERAYPQPDLPRATELFTFIRQADPEIAAIVYRMDQLYDARKIQEYLDFSEPYIEDNRINDPSQLYRYSSEKSNVDNSKKSLKTCYKIAERALELENDNPLHYFNLAQISFLQKNRKKAIKHARIALDMTKDNPEAQKNIENLLGQIREL